MREKNVRRNQPCDLLFLLTIFIGPLGFSYLRKEPIRNRRNEAYVKCPNWRQICWFAFGESDDVHLLKEEGVVEWPRHTVEVNNEPQRRKITILWGGDAGMV